MGFKTDELVIVIDINSHYLRREGHIVEIFKDAIQKDDDIKYLVQFKGNAMHRGIFTSSQLMKAPITIDDRVDMIRGRNGMT